MQTSNRDPGDRRRSSESITEKFVGFLPPEQVTVTSRLSELQVETPSVTVFPLNIEELAAVMRIAGAENLRVLPSGAGTWLEMGNAPRDPNLVVSTARMNRVLEYEPADLTATVEAGCTLSGFNTRALSHRQFIPLNPSGSDASTIGAVAATASYGPFDVHTELRVTGSSECESSWGERSLGRRKGSQERSRLRSLQALHWKLRDAGNHWRTKCQFVHVRQGTARSCCIQAPLIRSSECWPRDIAQIFNPLRRRFSRQAQCSMISRRIFLLRSP
jgi:hypothetical protein